MGRPPEEATKERQEQVFICGAFTTYRADRSGWLRIDHLRQLVRYGRHAGKVTEKRLDG